MTTVGIVGCGSIGRAILRAASEGQLSTPIGGVTSRTRETARAFLATLDGPPPLVDQDVLIETCDLIVEAAGGHVVERIARQAFVAGKSVVVIGVGALLDHPELFDLAHETQCDLLVPSGAIAGLDGVKAAFAGHVDYVRLTSRKPPSALEGRRSWSNGKSHWEG